MSKQTKEINGHQAELIADIIEEAGLSLKGKTFGELKCFIVKAVNEYEFLKAEKAALLDGLRYALNLLNSAGKEFYKEPIEKALAQAKEK